MGGGAMEVDLTHGAVAAMSRLQRGLRPVLQVVGAPARRGATVRYRFLLSDGVHSQEGILVPSLDSLVRTGRLRDGTVIRVLDYVCHRRVIIVIQLEVVQTECTLIGSPSSYQVNAAEPNTRSCSGSLGIHGSRAENGVNEMAFSPDQGLLCSSIAAREENAVNNLSFSGLHGSVLKQDTINAKMQQLSLNSHQGKMPAVCPTCQGFDPHPTEFSCQQPPPVYVNRGSVANNGTPSVTPFAFLNPYQGRWTIKGRVTAKTNHLHGKALSFDLLDARGGEIRATCFGSMVAQFSDQLVVGNVYFISGGLLKRYVQACSCGSTGHNVQNCPAAMDIQLPATGWDFMPYGSSASKAHLGTGPKTVQVRLVHMCSKCYQPGHWTKDCPGQASSYVSSASEARPCSKCNQHGHWAKDCPGQPSSYGSSASETYQCYKCNQRGHWAKDCPGQPSSYGSCSSETRQCYKCNQHGHWVRDCPKQAVSYGSSAGDANGGLGFRFRSDQFGHYPPTLAGGTGGSGGLGLKNNQPVHLAGLSGSG